MSLGTLLEEIVMGCRRQGILLILRPESTLGGCDGYYDDGVLKVAMKHRQWPQILAHEYSHMRQEKEGLWVDARPWTNKDAWLSHEKEITKPELEESFRAIQACEMDAEKRALVMLQKHGIAVDVKDFVRCVNADVLMYEYVRRKRRYPQRRWPSSVAAIRDMMPDVWLDDWHYSHLPEGYCDLVSKNCGPVRL